MQARHDRSAAGRRPLIPHDTVLRDVRFAARSIARTPGFFNVAIVALTLGFGSTAAIFSVVNGVLLRPLRRRELFAGETSGESRTVGRAAVSVAVHSQSIVLHLNVTT